MKFFKSKDFYSVALAVAISLAVVAISASAATTISTNILTGGTLGVTGLSTLTGGFVSQASSTVSNTLTTSGYLAASSTAGFTGLGTLYSGFVSLASSTLTGTTNLTGYLAASSTAGFTGLSTFYNGFFIPASSTISSTLNVTGYLAASSTSGFTGLSTFSNGFISTASSTLTTLSGTTTATFGIKVGSSGTAISQIIFGTCSVDFPSIVATTTAVATCAATGVASSTRIFVTDYDLPTGIVFTGASSTAASTIQVSAFNLGHNTTNGLGAAIDPPPTTWFWMGIQ